MLSPDDLLAIGLIASAVTQVLKLMGLSKEWAPPVVILVGGLLGVAHGLSTGQDPAHWLTLFGLGAQGGLTGAGAYSVFGATSKTITQRRKAVPRDHLGV